MAARKNDTFKLEKVSVRLVKDAPIASKHPIHSPEDAIEVLGEVLSEMDREVLCVINLKTDGTPINCTFASIGALSQTVAHPREMLKASILSNAAQMILLHCHPSGNLQPSVEDSMLTDRMVQICNIVGIPLLDHVIVGGDNSQYFSFKEKQMLPVKRMTLSTDYKDIEFAPPMVAEKERKGRR